MRNWEHKFDAIGYELSIAEDKLDKVLSALADINKQEQDIPALCEAMKWTSQAMTLLNNVYNKINEARLKMHNM